VALAEGDPAACALMTADGAKFAAEAFRADSCEAAIEEGAYSDAYFRRSPPAEVTEKLDSGVLEERGRNTSYRFCLPNETEVALDLAEVDGQWRVDLVSVSRKLEVLKDDGRIIEPCSLD
jgi:hypothetical protein